MRASASATPLRIESPTPHAVQQLRCAVKASERSVAPMEPEQPCGLQHGVPGALGIAGVRMLATEILEFTGRVVHLRPADLLSVPVRATIARAARKHASRPR